jgi:hypothetical protein
MPSISAQAVIVAAWVRPDTRDASQTAGKGAPGTRGGCMGSTRLVMRPHASGHTPHLGCLWLGVSASHTPIEMIVRPKGSEGRLAMPLAHVPTFADDAAPAADGLTAGTCDKPSAGTLMVPRYPRFVGHQGTRRHAERALTSPCRWRGRGGCQAG